MGALHCFSAPCHIFWRHANLGMTRERAVSREEKTEFGQCSAADVHPGWLVQKPGNPSGLSTGGRREPPPQRPPLSGLGVIHRSGHTRQELSQLLGVRVLGFSIPLLKAI